MAPLAVRQYQPFEQMRNHAEVGRRRGTTLNNLEMGKIQVFPELQARPASFRFLSRRRNHAVALAKAGSLLLIVKEPPASTAAGLTASTLADKIA